ncbi:MAG: Thioredoxin reductase [Candidatus Amesbacteria bacterium GW2011_GWC1_46_24]|nr:MAG: Thioredoxin reductase [Candidatus Amesbacteria bacterium GW2011_GWC1_46_24]
MEKIWDVVVIGSGPASFTCAIYTTRGAASTLILAGESWGGQLMLTTKVDNFPGFPDGIEGPDLMANMRKQAENLGAEIINKSVTKVDFSKTPFEIFVGEEKYLTKAVVIATGAQNVWLGVPGEKELIGRGISSCAPCDAPFFKGKIVAVVGGGDTAMEEASVLTKYASKVYLIHRRDTFRASSVMQEKVKKNHQIEIIWNTEIVRVRGRDRVESLELRNNSQSQSQVSNLPVDGLFVAIGHKPESDIFAGQVERDGEGYILPRKWHCGTSVKGVFLAGDVMDKHFKQAIVSAGMGCIAALDTLHYLSEND